jgi:hypothetical protein
MAEQNSGNKKVIRTSRIEVRGRTLVFDNFVYQIPNISVIEVGQLEKSIPLVFWLILLAAGAGLLLDYIGIFLLGLVVAGTMLYIWRESKEYGLIIRSNSGFTHLIRSKDLDFVKDVAVVLRNIMDGEGVESYTINLKTHQVIDNVAGSTIVMGDSTGDIVNRIN